MINARKFGGVLPLTTYRKEDRHFNLFSYKTSERRSEVG